MSQSKNTGLSFIFKPVTITFYLDQMRMVHQSIQHGSSERTVASKGHIPFSKREVGSQDDGTSFIAFGDDLKKQVGLGAAQNLDLLNTKRTHHRQ